MTKNAKDLPKNVIANNPGFKNKNKKQQKLGVDSAVVMLPALKARLIIFKEHNPGIWFLIMTFTFLILKYRNINFAKNSDV